MNYKINSGPETSAPQVNPSPSTRRCAVLAHRRTNLAPAAAGISFTFGGARLSARPKLGSRSRPQRRERRRIDQERNALLGRNISHAQSGNRSRPQRNPPGTRAVLQRRFSPRHFLAHHHARDVDRNGRPAWLGLSRDRGVYRASPLQAQESRLRRPEFTRNGLTLEWRACSAHRRRHCS